MGGDGDASRSRVGTGVGRSGRRGACAGNVGSSGVPLAVAGEAEQTTRRAAPVKRFLWSPNSCSALVRADFSVRGNMG